jgi:hypothetical protein
MLYSQQGHGFRFSNRELYLNQIISDYVKLISGFSLRLSVFDPRSGHMGFVTHTVALGRIISEYLCFPYQFSFHQLLHVR